MTHECSSGYRIVVTTTIDPCKRPVQLNSFASSESGKVVSYISGILTSLGTGTAGVTALCFAATSPVVGVSLLVASAMAAYKTSSISLLDKSEPFPVIIKTPLERLETEKPFVVHSQIVEAEDPVPSLAQIQTIAEASSSNTFIEVAKGKELQKDLISEIRLEEADGSHFKTLQRDLKAAQARVTKNLKELTDINSEIEDLEKKITKTTRDEHIVNEEIVKLGQDIKAKLRRIPETLREKDKVDGEIRIISLQLLILSQEIQQIDQSEFDSSREMITALQKNKTEKERVREKLEIEYEQVKSKEFDLDRQKIAKGSMAYRLRIDLETLNTRFAMCKDKQKNAERKYKVSIKRLEEAQVKVERYEHEAVEKLKELEK